MSKVRLPWTLEENHRHEVNEHGEYDNRCEICVTSNNISRHPRRVYSESCAFDHAGITFKEAEGRKREILAKHERDSRKFREEEGGRSEGTCQRSRAR